MTNSTTVTIASDILKNPPLNVKVPTYNRNALKESVFHLGVGGFHRSHQALYFDDLAEFHGVNDWAICGAGIMPQDEAMEKALNAQDCLYTLIEREGDKSTARVIGALKRYIFGYKNPQHAFDKLCHPEIKLVTLTATEGGYYFNSATGHLDLTNTAVQNDLKNPNHPQTIFGYLAESLDQRRKANIAPYTVLSCDNIQGNGHVLKRTLLSFCQERDAQLGAWVEKNVAFPNCMVDRITPGTTDAEREYVRTQYGLNDAYPIVAEPFRQWVVEDKFCNGRPPLELVGVQFTDSVEPYEKMKLRLLNATHSAMGYLGYLCGYRYIYEVAKSAEFQPYVKKLMDNEVTPLIGDVPGIDLADYKAMIMRRFANETLKDPVLRICMDGSSKMPKFILPSIEEQLAVNGPIRRLTLVVSSWIRFLSGKDEDGNAIPIDDPQAQRLKEAVGEGQADLQRVLGLTDLFGSLSQSERFATELQLQLNSFYEHGAKQTLTEFGLMKV